MKKYQINCRNYILPLTDEPAIMGILNVTPDSFSDGGRFIEPGPAVDHALAMIADGAKIIDVGGESTRPGSKPVSSTEQINRVTPVLKKLSKQTKIPISIDTTSASVARAALDAGASIVNDISALRCDSQMVELVAQSRVPVILMHMQGKPANMQTNPTYDNIVQEDFDFLAERIDFTVSAGVDRNQIVIDPGIGFGKKLEHNLLLMKNLRKFHQLNVPLLVGPSRKSFIGTVLGLDGTEDRLMGTAATVACCTFAGTQIIRVHDVKQMHQIVQMLSAIYTG